MDKSALGRLSYTVDQPFFVCLLNEMDMGQQLGPSLPMEKIEETSQILNTDSKTAPDSTSSPLSQAHLDQPLCFSY